jgi:hypothetical protein
VVIGDGSEWLRNAAAELADERGWPHNWINDGVKGWLSHRDADPGAKALFKTYPSEEEPSLRVFVASPHYLFAMKCLAMRIGGVDENINLVEDPGKNFFVIMKDGTIYKNILRK